jgi:hypothetical protein
MTIPHVDLFIEVHRLQDYPAHSYLFREIPVGTTFNAFNREPTFMWRVRLQPGFALQLDHPVSSYIMAFPPFLINSTKSTLVL